MDRGKYSNSNKKSDGKISARTAAFMEDVLPGYEEYLLLLQEKNRLVKKLRKKDKKQVELERKEQGFSLYVNGANAELKPDVSPDSAAGKSKNNLPKTAGELRRPNGPLTHRDLEMMAREERERMREKQRAKTAPSKTRRKNWNVESIEVTTERGIQRRIHAPDILTGRYEEDFESDDDSDMEIDASNHTRPLSPKKHSYIKKKADEYRQDLEDNRMTLKISDVKRLRQSLEMNKSIRQSLALEISSVYESKEDCILEEIQDESGDELAPTIQEESEEEVEEDIVQSIDKSNLNNSSRDKKPNPFKPGEMIVLEFAPSVKKREERSLSTVKRKRSESLLSARKSSDKLISPRSQQQVILNETKELQSVPSGKNKKHLKPLAARKSSSNNILSKDSQEEAQAVLAALQAENAQVEKYSKESKSKSKTPEKVMSKTPRPSALMPSSNSVKSPPQKPSASSSDARITDDRINDIVDKVLYMTPKQQCRLVKLFRKIDDDNVNSPQADYILNKREPLKALSPISSMTHNKQSLEIEVNIEILSNWGHPSRLGLTEIQFYNQDKQLIPVDTTSVRVHGVQQAHAPMDVLFNGKTKTTKERYMWVCDFSGKRLEFVISLKNPEPDKLFELSLIKVWNWNKSINGLDMGAKQVRVFMGGELVFDGDLDKGCGNHIYDYSTSINIKNNSHISDNGGNKTPSSSHHTFRSISRSSLSSASSSSSSRPVSATTQPLPPTPSSPIRSRTRTVMNSDTSLNRPVIDSDDESSPDSDNIAKDLKLPDQPKCHTPRKSKRLVARLDGHSSETESSKSVTDSNDKKPPLPSTTRSNVSLAGSTDIRQSKSNHKPPTPRSSQQLPSPRSSLQPPSPRSSQQPSPRSSQQPSPRVSQTKPPSSSINQDDFEPQDVSMLKKIKDMKLRDEPRRKDIPNWLNKDDFNAERFEGPPESRGYSRNQTRNDRLSSKIKEDDPVDDLINELDDVLSPFPSNSANDKKSSKSSQRDTEEFEDLEETPMEKIQKNRSKWREANLEESWGSLSFFNRSQRGRISMDMADDALDEYLPSKKTIVKEETIEEEYIINDNNEDNFTIPELPYGRQLTIDIKTTWGDHHYVGITGVEVFSSTGEQVQITKVTAEPLDINILPEYSKDPRVVTNIIDGCNRTRDDVHMWLTPFTTGSHHYVYLTLCKPCQIAMIRVWNYNKSRIHSYRGAREVTITLDKNIIFIGEIARACGGIEGGTESFGDTILFTTDEDILEEVSKNDEAFEGELLCEAEDEHVPYERPSTADESEDRPFTRAVGVIPNVSQPRPETSFITTINNVTAYKTKSLELNFTDTWGDPHYLGLTALEVIGRDGDSVPIKLSMLTANPRDVRVLPGHDNDARTLDKLIDGTTLTVSDEHMWLVPFVENKKHLLTITYPEKVLVTGLRIWNYNKSREDTYRGAKIVHVKIDGRQISPSSGYLIRKGPGSCHFDFAQEINFTCNNNNNEKGFSPVNHAGGVETSNDYEAVQMPCGFIYQFQLFATWSDQYYMGLNGLELYDENLKQIQLTDNNISAHPACVNVLDNMENDVRTPDKLINGINDTNDGKNTWLAPILPGLLNRVYVIFDQPTTVSMIKIWNYSKTPTRGVKDFALLVDDLLVYNGTLESVTPGAHGIIPTCSIPQKYHTVLFTQNPDLVRREKHTIINNQAGEQDVQLLNDKKIITKYADPKKAQSGKPVNQEFRPKTSVTGQMKLRR